MKNIILFLFGLSLIAIIISAFMLIWGFDPKLSIRILLTSILTMFFCLVADRAIEMEEVKRQDD